MNSELGFTDKLKPELRAEITQQLLDDLKYYGIQNDNLRIDWSETAPEGHYIFLHGSLMDNWSSIGIFDVEGTIVAAGDMDWIYAEPDRLYIFWGSLCIWENDKCHDAKKDFDIPLHLWNRLPEDVKDQCLNDRHWNRDPLVIAWKRKRGLP